MQLLYIQYLVVNTYCVCVKRRTLYTCPCSSSSSCFPASVIWNIGEFRAKNYFTDHRTANTIHGFRYSVLVFKTRLLLGYVKIWKLSILTQAITRQEQCVDVNNPLQTVFKHFRLYILT